MNTSRKSSDREYACGASLHTTWYIGEDPDFARSFCGIALLLFRAALVDRYHQPYKDSPYVPDFTVDDFTQLADQLC